MINAREAAELLNQEHGDEVQALVSQILIKVDQKVKLAITDGFSSTRINTRPDQNIWHPIANHVDRVVRGQLENKGFCVQTFDDQTNISWGW